MGAAEVLSVEVQQVQVAPMEAGLVERVPVAKAVHVAVQARR